MQYRSIDELQNQYIADSDRTRVENTVSIRTEFDNVVTVDVSSETNVEDLQVIEDVDISFIVEIENNYYTSQRIVNQLNEARNETNPFFTTQYITVATINMERIRELRSQLERDENVTGVNITTLLDTPEQIVRQLFWATSPVPLDGSVPSPYTNEGEWTVDRIPNQTFNANKSVRILDEDELPDPPADDDDNDDDDSSNGNDEVNSQSSSGGSSGAVGINEDTNDVEQNGSTTTINQA